MLESSVLRYCLYGSCVVISSELLYHSYFWFKKLIKQRSSTQEVCEVIWTNELTQSCAAQHRFDNIGTAGAPSASPHKSSPSMYSKGRIAQLPSPSKLSSTKCSNPFCAAYNVGRLIEFIDSAKYSIDLAMYTFTSYEVAQAFTRALKRGVLIRIISDNEMAYSSGSQIIPLTRAGVPIRCNTKSTAIMHHKFCILDSPNRVEAVHKKQKKFSNKGQARSIFMTGSLNWTMQGFGSNWENILITSNMDYISKYSEEFERLWNVFDVDFKENNKK